VFLVTPEGIILADPINADFSKWLKGELASRFKVPVRYVVYSHHHWDHDSGGDVFADTARFVGHANMLTHLAMPPASTTLSQVVGQYQPVTKSTPTATESSKRPKRRRRSSAASSTHSTQIATADSAAPKWCAAQ
jgi:glyoxylase-like metal-dependent hydrolase (beta-lactamase superfamily II)